MKSYVMILILLTACLSKDKSTPRDVLNQLVKLQFSTDMTKEKLASFFTDELAQEFSNLSEEEFKQSFNLANKRLTSFKIDSEKCQDNFCTLIYLVGYRELDPSGQERSEVNVKKVATFVNVDPNGQSWKMKDVSDIKTHIELKE